MGTPVYSNLDMLNSSRVVNLPMPANSSDAASKAYVDAIVNNLSWKDDVVAVSFTPYTNTGTIDGVTLVAGDRVLLLGEGGNNGIYIIKATGNPVLASDSVGNARKGAVVKVTGGTVNAGKTFAVGTDLITWTEFAAGIPYASNAEVAEGVSTTKVVTPASLKTIACRLHTEIVVPDETGMSSVITHNFGTESVIVQIIDDNGRTMLIDVVRDSGNTVIIYSDVVIPVNAWTALVIGIPT